MDTGLGFSKLSVGQWEQAKSSVEFYSHHFLPQTPSLSLPLFLNQCRLPRQFYSGAISERERIATRRKKLLPKSQLLMIAENKNQNQNQKMMDSAWKAQRHRIPMECSLWAICTIAPLPTIPETPASVISKP